MPLIRSVSGLRGTTPDGILSAELVARHVRAFAEMQPHGPIAIGFDGRLGGRVLADAAIEELCCCGRDVLDLGCVPTPTVQIIVERNHLAGGVIVTASHNSAEWNGLKFLDSDGVFLLPERARHLWQRSDYPQVARSHQRGHATLHSDPIEEHLAALGAVELIARLRAQGAFVDMRVVIDAVNAGGSSALPRLIEWLGGEPLPLYCDGSGIFPHLPEPLPEHLYDLCRATAEHNATLGIAVDPDADRLVLVHRSGMPINEEKTIVLAVESVLREMPNATVVVNASTTSQVERVATRYGGMVLRSAVGEINVIELMRSSAAVIGGEGSGGVIFPACHYGRDSLVGTALVLALRTALSNDEWDERTLYQPLEMRKRKVPWNGNFSVLRAALVATMGDGARLWEGDGIRFEWNDHWLHVRPSNTEPILRMIAESPALEQVEELLDRVEQIIATVEA
ncbi:MAG: hypothetical protein N2663_05690 [Chlorobi bacterium]|nr:hypothetical protein [Chlorobiota bacterium]